MNLIDGSQVNVLNQPGLTEISFEILLPQTKYPFADYKSGIFRGASYFLKEIEKLKLTKKPFQFVVWREKQGIKHGVDKNKKLKFGSTHLYDTNISVSLEDYEITEEAENGYDIMVSIKLKQYNAYGTKKVVFKKPDKPDKPPKVTTTTDRNTSGKKKAKTHKVVKGDCLWNLAKKYYNDATQHPKIYAANKKVIEKAASEHGRSSSSNGYWIYPGTVLNIP